MGNIDFNVDAVGMKEILNRIDAVGNVPRCATKALNAGARVVLRAAKDLAPIRTGKLKGALKVGRRKKNRDAYDIEVGVFGGEVGYAHWVHGGHGGPKPAPPNPFLETAADMTEREAIDAIMEELMRGI